MLLRTLFLLVVAAIVLKMLVPRLEPLLVFFPSKGEHETPEHLGIRYTALQLHTSDGQQIVAWQLEPDRPKADIVYFHGNGGNLSLWLPVFATLHELGYRVLAIDYRGYGRSTGTPSEEGIYRDAEAAVRHAAGHRARPERPLVFWGRSLGGPVAAAATRVVTPDGLILESTFANKAAVVRSNVALRALNAFASYRFPTADLLRDFRQPTLVVHAERDTIVPFPLGRELFDRLSGPKRFVRVGDADHNDFFETTNAPYWQPIVEFIDALQTHARSPHRPGGDSMRV
jgi:fermentation-respiration switch protein FrsA (DUF1100 family)